MTWFDHIDEPSESELRRIEGESELLAAELAVVDAEVAWATAPCRHTAVELITALLHLIDVQGEDCPTEQEVAA